MEENLKTALMAFVIFAMLMVAAVTAFVIAK